MKVNKIRCPDCLGKGSRTIKVKGGLLRTITCNRCDGQGCVLQVLKPIGERLNKDRT